jgi:type II secretory pathway component PulF
MEDDLKEQLKAQQEFMEKIYRSAEKTRKYFMWTLITSLVVFIIPLIIMMFVLPSFINTYMGELGAGL